MPFDLQHIAVCDSTNRAILNYPPNTVLWADCQTAGRGRRGHTWQSKKGEGIYFSMLLDGKIDSTLPLLTSLAILGALQNLGACNLFLKWPNDIFYKTSKIGGILVEKNVVGIGLNLKTPQVENADYPISALAEVFENMPPIEKIITSILQEFEKRREEGFLKNKSMWESHALWRGKMVRLETETGVFSGIFEGVDFQGALRLSNFKQAFFSGSLRCPSSV